MGIQIFEIKLSSLPPHVYYPGEVIHGVITLVSTADVDLSGGITITLYGYGFAQWTHNQGRISSTYTGHDELFKRSILKNVSSKRTEYPFTMEIPDIPGLPWTTTREYGNVQYGVNATIKSTCNIFGDKRVKHSFQLRSHLQPSTVPLLRNRHYYDHTFTEKNKNVNAGFCCFPFCCWYYCGNERISVTLKTESLWAYPGAEINFTLTVDNTLSKSHVGNVTVQLVGRWFHRGTRGSLFVQGGSRKDMEKKEICCKKKQPMEISPGQLKNTAGKLKLPKGLLPTQVEWNVLQLTYKLKAKLNNISGFRCTWKKAVEVDIIIGSEPVSTSSIGTPEVNTKSMQVH